MLDLEYINPKSGTVFKVKIPDQVVEILALHGAKQKLGDSHAGVKDAGEANAAIRAVAEKIQAGDIGTGGGGPRLDPIFRYVRDRVAKALDVKKAVHKTFPSMEATRLIAFERIADMDDKRWNKLLKVAKDNADFEV